MLDSQISHCCRLGCIEFDKSLEREKSGAYVYDLLHRGSYCPCMQEVKESLIIPYAHAQQGVKQSG